MLFYLPFMVIWVFSFGWFLRNFTSEYGTTIGDVLTLAGIAGLSLLSLKLAERNK